MPIVVGNGIEIGNGITITSGSGGGGGSVVTGGLQVQLRPDSYSGSGTTWQDTQGNADATLINSPINNPTTGFTFDGLSNYATLPSISGVTDFDAVGSYTVEVWFNGTLGQFQAASTVIEKWEYAPGRPFRTPYAMQFSEPASNTSNFATQPASGGNTNAVSSPTIVSNWYQNIITCNYTNAAIDTNAAKTTTAYLNGVRQTSSFGNLSLFTNVSNPYMVGIARRLGLGPTGQTPGWFKGQIGIIRIYNRALTSSEILQNFNADRAIFGI